MKRLTAILLMISTALLLLCGCTGGEKGLTLYILPVEKADAALSSGALARLAKEEGRAVLEGTDFAGVDWENQRFAVKAQALPSVSTLQAETGGSSLLKTTDADAFVWVLDGRALYTGGFPVGTANPNPQKDCIIRDEDRYCFAVEYTGSEDKRFNKKLYKYFYDNGLLQSEI